MTSHTQPETYVITFHVLPDQVGLFLALLDPVVHAMRHEPTFVRYTLHVDPERSNVFQLHETWTDRADVLNVQLNRPYRAAFHENIDALLVEPRHVAIWTVARSD